MDNAKACFLCGTGTDVGKSVVCAGLLQAMPFAQAIKVVQTGDTLLDQHLYAEASPRSRVRTLRHFRYPASPHLAAEREGRAVDFDALVREAREEALQARMTLLEGAGGVMSPLSATHTFLDCMTALGFPVVLVVGNVLGAISHALLSLGALRNAGLHVEGVIITHPDAGYGENHPVARDNRAMISKLGRVDILGVVPHLPALLRPGDREEAWNGVAGALARAAARLSGPCRERECAPAAASGHLRQRARQRARKSVNQIEEGETWA